MGSLLVACAGFLLAVLWLDLAFDVQVLRHRGERVLPEAVLASIAGYYRRVTTDAYPMNLLVAGAMVVGLAAALERLLRGTAPLPARVAALVLLAAPTALALARTVPSAVRLGTRADPVEGQSALARAICRDHLACLACVAALLGLTLLAS